MLPAKYPKHGGLRTISTTEKVGILRTEQRYEKLREGMIDEVLLRADLVIDTDSETGQYVKSDGKWRMVQELKMSQILPTGGTSVKF
jgi:hypothetical protein